MDDPTERREGRSPSKGADPLTTLLYGELRRLARSYLRHERQHNTLDTTGLVHEAYLRLARQGSVDWANRAQVLGVAAQMMRRVLVDRARRRRAAKRVPAAVQVPLDEVEDKRAGGVDVLALDEALHGLARLDPQQAHIVELRFFGGLSVEETAEVAGISTATVKREWSLAKAWLRREVTRPSSARSASP
jgi:RNA polymerase sigma factor (TIGR02999 family)